MKEKLVVFKWLEIFQNVINILINLDQMFEENKDLIYINTITKYQYYVGSINNSLREYFNIHWDEKIYLWKIFVWTFMSSTYNTCCIGLSISNKNVYITVAKEAFAKERKVANNLAFTLNDQNRLLTPIRQCCII